MILLLCRIFVVMHLLLHLRQRPSASSIIIKSVSAFPAFGVAPQRRQQQLQRRSLYIGQRQTVYTTLHISRQLSMSRQSSSLTTENNIDTGSKDIANPQRPIFDEKHVQKVLFVECGFGSDAHGQNSTKAAVRACRNAIEFNQIPCIGELIPGGRENMKLDVLLGVPVQYQNDLDLNAIRQCFPYGKVHIQCPSDGGGLVASSGKVIVEMGDTNDDMIIVCVAVTVGY